MAEKNVPDPDKRSLFELFRDPERFGRELGRAFRELREGLNPRTVPLERYEQALNQIEILEARVEELEKQQLQDQETVRQLILLAVSQDKKLTEVLELLQKSTSGQDRQQIPRWRKLRERLWKILTTLAGGTALAGALRDAWVQEKVWPVVETLPERARDTWIEFLKSGQVEQPPPEVQPAPEPSSISGTSLVPELILIPAGEFLMGSQAYKDEQPQHTLYLPDYYIAKTPITNARYAAFVAASGYRTTAEKEGWGWVWTGSWERVEGADWRHPRGPRSNIRGKGDHPVVQISWYDALAFCEWLSQKTGKPYRLPSEAEWEKAARGTDGRIYPWGDQWDASRCNAWEGGKRDTTPVGAYPRGASPYGVLDMAGNVWEWTRSLWGTDSQKPDFTYPYNPGDGREDLAAPQTVRRVLRGGAFFDDVRYVRCALRYRNFPNVRLDFVGFRVVVVPPYL